MAAIVLMLQHAPIAPTDHGSHEHCIHCTENYCFKDKCSCDHKHKPEPPTAHAFERSGGHDHGKSHVAGDHHRKSVSGDHHGESLSSGDHGERLSDGDHGERHVSAESHAPADHTATLATTIKPCGSPPSGIITFNLDKFVGAGSALGAQRAFERPSSARYVALSDQLVIDQIFRPPVLG